MIFLDFKKVCLWKMQEDFPALIMAKKFGS